MLVRIVCMVNIFSSIVEVIVCCDMTSKILETLKLVTLHWDDERDQSFIMGVYKEANLQILNICLLYPLWYSDYKQTNYYLQGFLKRSQTLNSNLKVTKWWEESCRLSLQMTSIFMSTLLVCRCWKGLTNHKHKINNSLIWQKMN